MSLPAPRSKAGRSDLTRHGGSAIHPCPSQSSLARAAGALALALCLAAPEAPRAQSKSDAFAGKIPPVSAGLFRKAGRWELTLSGNVSVNDAFYSKYFGGLKVGYHFTESMSAGVYTATGLATKAGSAQVCPTNGGCHPADREQMWQVPGRIRLMTGVEGAWSPVYGKLNLFSEQVAHFDLSVLAGADWISHQKVFSQETINADDFDGKGPGTESTIGAHLGLGVRVFFTEAVALRLEFRDYVYRVQVPNLSGNKRDLQNQLFAEIGVSFFLPFHNRPVQ